MPLSINQSLIMFGIMALVTAILRAIPFLMFPDNKETPKYNILPYYKHI